MQETILKNGRQYRSHPVFIQCVTGGGIGLCGEHIMQLYTVYLTRFRTYKIALPPQGALTDKHQVH
jgi:hypothetical protein